MGRGYFGARNLMKNLSANLKPGDRHVSSGTVPQGRYHCSALDVVRWEFFSVGGQDGVNAPAPARRIWNAVPASAAKGKQAQ